MLITSSSKRLLLKTQHPICCISLKSIRLILLYVISYSAMSESKQCITTLIVDRFSRIRPQLARIIHFLDAPSFGQDTLYEGLALELAGTLFIECYDDDIAKAGFSLKCVNFIAEMYGSIDDGLEALHCPKDCVRAVFSNQPKASMTESELFVVGTCIFVVLRLGMGSTNSRQEMWPRN
jgi:hypothetical protein